MPIASLGMHMPNLVSCNVMKPMMVAMHADPMAPFASQLFEAICDAFEKCHTQWTASTTVNNVMAMGAVPSCLPPFFPPGPVVGTAIMAPGGLM